MIPQLVDAIAIPAVFIGRSERIEAMNAGARAMFGEAAVERHYITVLRQPAMLDAVESAFRTSDTRHARFLTSEGLKDRTWHATISPVLPDAGLLISFEDRSGVEDAEQMRRDFVANVSHELKTPLTAVIGFIDTLRGAARNDPAAQERFLKIMNSEASRMNRLVQDLISLNRVESQERQRPTGMVDLAALATSTMKSLSHIAETAGVTLAGNGLNAEISVPGDEDQLLQVISNLIENAIKYSGRDCEVSVEIICEDMNPMVRGRAAVLTVADTGDGFDPVHIPRLTERFYRIDSHRSREMGGTGLGLAIVKHIVARHRGRLRIKSEIGEGSRFSIILPREVAPNA
ncbi:MAG: ATP-binding protein [Paracoccaceae bacterium]|nr:ATP-binding protein [Paracoccaceae bacterium]